jgi:hypothetical protein
VFSVGSIQWCSCLPARDYSGTVAVVTRNVLRRFLDPAPLGLGGQPLQLAGGPNCRWQR